MKTARELYEEHRVMIIKHPMDKPASETCTCGHHISKHHGDGTAAYCEVCQPARKKPNAIHTPVHAFTPSNWREATAEKRRELKEEKEENSENKRFIGRIKAILGELW